MDKRTDRRLEISSKLIEMGNALIIEGKENKDFAISHTGSFLAFISTLMFDESDARLFGEICCMFSAKKMLQNLESNNNGLLEQLTQMNIEESFEDFIKRINKIREDDINSEEK